MEGEDEARKGWASRAQSWLSAPLLITVVGALLAGYLIPRIATRAEDHRQARDIQVSLVQSMSQSVARVAVTGQLLATESIRKENGNGNSVFDAALLQWEQDRAAVGGQLQAYFARGRVGHERMPAAWERYSNAVEDLYYLATTRLPDRCLRATRLKAYLDPGRPAPTCRRPHEPPTSCARAVARWDVLALCDEDSTAPRGEGYVRGPNYFAAYRAEVDNLLGREAGLLDAIRASTPSGF